MTKTMNKRLYKITLLFLIVIFLVPFGRVVCRAEENVSETVNSNIENIIENFKDILPEGSDFNVNAEDISEAVGVKRILSEIVSTIKGEGNRLSAFLLSLLGVCLMSALASQIEGELSAFACRIILVVFSVMLFDKLIFLVTGAVDSLKQINEFFGAVVPVSVAVNSIGVSPSVASTQALGMGVTLGVYSFISGELLASLVGVIFVCAAASAVDPVFERFSSGIKNLFLSLTGILTVLMGATFSLQSAISASADSALIRSAKYAVSSSIPIVGNAVSGALGIALGGVSYARGIVGGGAIAVVIILMLSPLVTILAYRMCLKAGIFFSSVCRIDGSGGVLSAFLGAVDTLVAVYSLTCFIYIAELVAFLKGGVSLAG